MNLKRCRMASDVNNKGNLIAKLCLTNILYKLKNCATEGYRLYEYIKQHKLRHSLGCTLSLGS